MPGALIDERNQQLWADINNEYTVTLEHSLEPNFSCYTQYKTAIIYIPRGSTCADSFTHELLHIYMKVKGALAGNCLTLRTKTDQLLSSFMTDGLMEHIGNCLDHDKMLPIYLSLGFERKRFISDFQTPKCSNQEIDLIRAHLRPHSGQWRAATDLYVGKFFGIKACPNSAINYQPFLTMLKAIDGRLYKILESFWKSWEGYDVENQDPVFNSYYDFCDKLIEDLKAWAVIYY